ncbi:MAG: sigma-70 factor domain-containing protein, partial [Aquihabitans sp.]
MPRLGPCRPRVGDHRRPGASGSQFPQKRCKMAKERVERDEEDLVRLYLTDIGQYPLLTKDDEVRLAQAIEA